jgi:hypothetical protein
MKDGKLVEFKARENPKVDKNGKRIPTAAQKKSQKKLIATTRAIMKMPDHPKPGTVEWGRVFSDIYAQKK